jgi:hypothetical protein
MFVGETIVRMETMGAGGTSGEGQSVGRVGMGYERGKIEEAG